MKSYVIRTALLIALLFLSSKETNSQWVRMDAPYGWEFNNFAVINSTILGGSPSQGVYRSTDNGLHWVEANSGLWANSITSLGVFKQNFLAGAWDGTNNLLFLSSDNGSTWSQVNTINPSQSITCFTTKDTILFAGTYGDGVYRSTDGGFHWIKPNNAGLQYPVVSLLVIDSNIYAGTWGGGVYKSTNMGDSWAQLSIPNYNPYVTSLFVHNSKLYMASSMNLYNTTDNGLSWNIVSTSMPFKYNGTMIVSGSNIYLGSGQGMFLSTDDGNSWSNIGFASAIVEAIAVSGGNLIAGTSDVGIFTTQDNGTNWLQTGAVSNMLVQALAVIDSNLVVGDAAQEGVFVSRDNGDSYKEYYNLNHSYVLCLKTRGTDFYAGTEKALDGGGGIFKSSDYGKSWNYIGLKNMLVFSINYNQSYLFVGSDQGVLRTANEGATWEQVNNGLPSTRINDFEVMDTVLFVGTDAGIFRSTNNGTNWTPYGFADTSVTSLLKVGTALFAGTQTGIFSNVPPDTNWVRIGFADSVVTSLEIKNGLIFAGINNKLFISRDNGISWSPINTGFDNTAIPTFTLGDNFLFAGSWGEGVWRRPLSEVITGITVDRNILPSQFSLNQNYPNPFNPTTTISYQLSANSKVTLKIYDVLGNEVASLVNEEKPAGRYSVNFNGSKLASGVYFYRMQAGSIVETKKLILLK